MYKIFFSSFCYKDQFSVSICLKLITTRYFRRLKKYFKCVSKSQLHNKFAKKSIINDKYYDWITKSFEDRYTRNVMQKKKISMKYQ